MKRSNMMSSIFPVPDWDDDVNDAGGNFNSSQRSSWKKKKKLNTGKQAQLAERNGADGALTATKNGNKKIKRKLEGTGAQIEVAVVKKKKVDPELDAKLPVRSPTAPASIKPAKLNKKRLTTATTPPPVNSANGSEIVKREKKKKLSSVKDDAALSNDKPAKKLSAMPVKLNSNLESIKLKKKKKNLEKQLTSSFTGKAPVKVLKSPGSVNLIKGKQKKQGVENGNGLSATTAAVSPAKQTQTVDTNERSKVKKKKKEKLDQAKTEPTYDKLQEKVLKRPDKIQLANTKKQKLDIGERMIAVSSTSVPPTGPSKVAGNVFREKLVERLKGSRFRFINEQLYRTSGKEALKLFQEDPDAFHAYHEGYRHQLVQWSMNPLNRIIKSILKLPKQYVIADFGCGEARLAESVPHLVYSLDLVAVNDRVIACDMANTPLESNFVNVVVFCLSLMGTNLQDFLIEANRVLKVGGLLKIAEVSSRFGNINEFVSNVKSCGFSLEVKDYKNKLFYFFQFKKDRTVSKAAAPRFSLKPCLYKKR